jgi:hypothetical protein
MAINTPNFINRAGNAISGNLNGLSLEELSELIIGAQSLGIDSTPAQTRFVSLLEAQTSLSPTDILLFGRVVGFLNEDVLALIQSKASQTSVNDLTAAVANIPQPDLSRLDTPVSTRATEERLDQVAANLTLADIINAISNIPQNNVSNLDATVSSRVSTERLDQMAANRTLQNVIDAISAIPVANTSNLDALVSSRATPQDISATQTALELALNNKSDIRRIDHYTANLTNVFSVDLTINNTFGKAVIVLEGAVTNPSNDSGLSAGLRFLNNTTVRVEKGTFGGAFIQYFAVVSYF